jgi:hypothetical protein
MGFNTRYIFKGDSDKVIRDKINYNFNQVIFFGVGPDGHVGPRGATGIFGPAGFKGKKGPTGDKATDWYRQPTEPTGSAIYDVWINTSTNNGDIYTLGPTGWVYSQFSSFNSSFFEAYNNILGPGSAIDKSTIGFKSLNVPGATASLVISDRILDSNTVNKNASKVIVSTLDSTLNPIMTFGKSNGVSSGVPSFYWENSGSNNDISLRSSGNISFISGLNFSLDTSTASTILNGNTASFICDNGFRMGGTGDFYMTTNYSTGSGRIIEINSGNLGLSSDFFNVKFPMTMRTSNSNSYVFSSIPLNPKLNTGIVIDSTNQPNRVFEIIDTYGASYISQAVSGPNGSGNFSQTIIGSTGGYTGGTGGPFSYLVKSSSNYLQNTISITNCRVYSTNQGVAPSTGITINNVIDMSQTSLWANDVIVLTPTSYTNSSDNGIYIRIPSSNLTSNSPLYEDFSMNTYKIFLNPPDSNYQAKHFRGFVFSIDGINYYYNFGGTSTPSTPGLSCHYVEFSWVPRASQNRQAPRAIWKTCNGYSGFVDFEITTVSAPVNSSLLTIDWRLIMSSTTSTFIGNDPLSGDPNFNISNVYQTSFSATLRASRITSNGTEQTLFQTSLPGNQQFIPGTIGNQGVYSSNSLTTNDNIRITLNSNNASFGYDVNYSLSLYDQFGVELASDLYTSSASSGANIGVKTVIIPASTWGQSSNPLYIVARAERVRINQGDEYISQDIGG